MSKWLAVRMYNRYNHSFLLALGLQYFNTGLVLAMLSLATGYIFLNIYKLEPGKMSQLSSYISLPWVPKLLYGIITDTVPICGSGKRSYIFMMGML